METWQIPGIPAKQCLLGKEADLGGADRVMSVLQPKASWHCEELSLGPESQQKPLKGGVSLNLKCVLRTLEFQKDLLLVM